MEAVEKQEAIEKIESLINLRIKPLLQQDGGDIVFHDFDDSGIVHVELTGACSGCPHASETLKNVVFETLQYFVPEVTGIKSVEN